MLIDRVIKLERTGLTGIEPIAQMPALAAGQVLQGVVRAVSPPNVVTLNFGRFQLTAESNVVLKAGEQVKLQVLEAGSPLKLKLLSITGEAASQSLEAEALLPLLQQPATATGSNAQLRALLAQAEQAGPLAQQLHALLAPLNLAASPQQLAQALAQQLASSGLFLESKLKRDAGGADVKAAALKLLAKLEADSAASAAPLRAALGELLQTIEANQARNHLSLISNQEITVPLSLLLADQELATEVTIKFEELRAGESHGLIQFSLALKLSALGPVRVELTMGRNRELLLTINTEGRAEAELISADLARLRGALALAGFNLISAAAQPGPLTPIESSMPETGVSPPLSILIDERA